MVVEAEGMAVRGHMEAMEVMVVEAEVAAISWG
jgi:hypothetical protein